MAFNLATAALIARQDVNPTGVAGCTNYEFSKVENCITSAISSNYPSCYDYYSDKGCCSTWLSWEVGYFDCLQTAYDNCFDFTAYLSGVSAFLPCYTEAPFTKAGAQKTAPKSASATPTRIPELSFESITYGTPSPTPDHASVAQYSGTGQLLKGYCNTPNYVLLDGPTAFWAPVVGCADDKTDCCPYSVQQTSTGPTGTTVTVVSTITVNVGPGGTGTAFTGAFGYPQAQSAQEATLQHCPEDYVTISGGCCPSGYQLWNEPVGGAVPCYSSLSSTLRPPVVPIPGLRELTGSSKPTTASSSDDLLTSSTSTSSTSSYSPTDSKPTSAVVNVVYAVQYPVRSKSSLTTGAKAGIGVGTGAAGLAIIVLALLLVRKYRSSKKDKEQIARLSTTGPESQTGTSTMSPYAYSTRTELHSDGIGGVQQSPSSGFASLQAGVPTNGYFGHNGQPQNGGFYGSQPADYSQQQQMSQTVPVAMQGHQVQRRPLPGQHLQYSPPPSTVSPPPGDGSQSFQSYTTTPPPPQQHSQSHELSPQQQQQQFYPPPQQQQTQIHELPPDEQQRLYGAGSQT